MDNQDDPPLLTRLQEQYAAWRKRFASRYDVPFSGRDSYAALPWIIAFMVFLTVLCLTWAVDVQQAALHWQQSQDRQLTLNVPLDEQETPTPIYDGEKIRALLLENKQVAKVTLLTPAEVRKLLKPWLGDDDKLAFLPLPLLVEIELEASADAARQVRQLLREKFPKAQLEDHSVWLEDFQQLIRTLQWCALGIVLGIVAITGVILAMSTRTELALHHKTLDLLRSLGAERDYISKQFQANALVMSMRGVVVGGLCALLMLWALSHAAGELNAPFLPLQHSGWLPWLILLVIAVVADLLVSAVAKATIMRRLASLDGEGV